MLYAESIKKDVVEMWQLVQSQLSKSCQSIIKLDKDLAREVTLIEDRVDCCELLIDKECEVFMALSQDQPNDLPFVMTILKTKSHLEKIGDIAADVATEIIQSKLPYTQSLMKETQILAAFSIAIKMLDIARFAFEREDTELAMLVLRRSRYLEGFNKDIELIIRNYLSKKCDDASSAVHILSIVRSLETVAELASCLANNMIDYLRMKSEEAISA